MFHMSCTLTLSKFGHLGNLGTLIHFSNFIPNTLLVEYEKLCSNKENKIQSMQYIAKVCHSCLI